MNIEQNNAAPITNQAAEVKPAETGAPAATEKKGDEGKPPAGSEQKPVEKPAENKPAEAKPNVPAELKLELPKDSKLDATDLERVLSYAKEKGLSSEQASELLARENEAVASYAEKQAEILKQTNEVTWKNELMADPEFGGAKFEEHGQIAHRAAERFFGKEFADELKATNLNHQPALFRGLVRIGKMIQDDKALIPGLGGSEQKPIEKIFYGKQQ